MGLWANNYNMAYMYMLVLVLPRSHTAYIWIKSTVFGSGLKNEFVTVLSISIVYVLVVTLVLNGVVGH